MNKQQLLELKEKAFDKQRAVIRDKSKRIALFVGRRGAKTTTIVLLFLMFALLHYNIRLVFIGLTGEQAENAFYPHAFRFLQELGFNEGAHYFYNKTERLFTFAETGSTISIKGNDNSYKEMDKILGGKCFAVAIDECQSQTQDLEKAILHKIQPAVSDYLPLGGGLIILAGTAGDFMGSNYWYRVCSTEPNHLGWSFHTWLDKENPHMLQAKLMEDKEFEAMYGPDFQQEDWYKQQYLNQWIVSGRRLVYYLTSSNLIGYPECQHQPPSPAFLHSATYGLGMDFGFSPDPMAFLVVAYNTKFSDKLYVIEEYQQTEMYVSDVSKKITQLDKKYHFTFMVADAGAQAKAQVADLNDNYGHFIIAADKAGKFAHQNTINSDLRSKNILIDAIACPQLINELQNLIWDPVKLNTTNTREEKDRLPNHLCDSLLYIHHHCRHLWYQAPKPKPDAQEYFTDAILKGEQKLTSQNILSMGKQRFNPYSRRPHKYQ